MTWTFSGLNAGYYLVMANDLNQIETSLEVPDDAAFPARMLFVASNITQQIKESVPVFDKFVVPDGKSEQSNTDGFTDNTVAGVGDVVEFQLRGTLPTNFEKYDAYEYIFTDTLDPGLDLVKYSDGISVGTSVSTGDVKVRVIGAFKKVDEHTPNAVTYADPTDGNNTTYWLWDENIVLDFATDSITNPGGSTGFTINYINGDAVGDLFKHKLTIDFEDLIKLRFTKDTTTYRLGFYYEGIGATGEGHTHDGGVNEKHSSRIFVNYKARLNENAVISPATGSGATKDLKGNLNAAYLTYSDDPSNQNGTTTTVTEKATVYTFGLKISKEDYAKKVEGATDGLALENAEFAILKSVVDNGENYWQIAKLTAPDAENAQEVIEWTMLLDADDNKIKSSTNGDDLIKAVTAFIKSHEAGSSHDSPNTYYYVKTNVNGKTNFKGLDVEVVYTLVETVPPSNLYAQLSPFTVTLKAAKDTSGNYDGKLAENGVEATKNIQADGVISTEHFVNPIDNDTDTDGIGNIEVINFKYVDLPSTGGIGVYIYYIAGGIVVAAAILLFALSKKHSRKSS